MWTRTFNVQAGFRKGRGTRDRIANVHQIIEKNKGIPEKNIYFCFIDYAEIFDCVDNNKLWKMLKDRGISDHPACLLRNLYTGQAATVRILCSITDWFKIGKRVWQGRLPPCLTSMQSKSCKTLGWMNHKLESRLWGQISTTSDDTTLIQEREEKLKSLLIRINEEWKSWPKTQHSKH